MTMSVVRGSSNRGHGVGSAAMELVLLTPVLVVLMVFVVFAGRAGEGLSELRHAADQGARAASQVSRTRMDRAARAAVLSDLRTSGLSCVDPTIALRTSSSAAGTSVTVTVTCRVSDSGVRVLRLGSRTLRAASTEIVDRFRTES